jgi:hypothetical protein
MLKKPPSTDEIELSVFGRGYGECLVISCGSNEFVVVDSFVNKETGNPIALDYLDAMSIDATAIKQVVLTHWHQDHITGIANILQTASPDAKLVISPIIQREKFNEYMTIGVLEENESTTEFAKIMKFMVENRSRIIVPTPNRLIYPYSANDVEIFTLSPNDADLFEYINSIDLPDEQRKTIYSFPESNILSIVMLIKFGNDGVLLGSDLETTTDVNSGWKGLVNSYYHSENKPSLIKIPHHGSINAHYDDLWTMVLKDKPLSVLTVFNKGRKLPAEGDIDRIKNLSRRLFIVGDQTKRSKEIERKAKKIMKDVTIVAIPNRIGLTRFRRSANALEWRVEKFGAVSCF